MAAPVDKIAWSDAAASSFAEAERRRLSAAANELLVETRRAIAATYGEDHPSTRDDAFAVSCALNVLMGGQDLRPSDLSTVMTLLHARAVLTLTLAEQPHGTVAEILALQDSCGKTFAKLNGAGAVCLGMQIGELLKAHVKAGGA